MEIHKQTRTNTLLGILSDADSNFIECGIPDAGCSPEQRARLQLNWSHLMDSARALGLPRCELFAADCDGGHSLGARELTPNAWHWI